MRAMTKAWVSVVLGLSVASPVRGEVIAEYTGSPTNALGVSTVHTQAMAFDVTGNPTVTEIQLNLQRCTGSTGYVVMQLRPDSNGSPASGMVAQIPKPASDVSADAAEWFSFKWSGGGTSISAGRWWIVCKVSSTSDAEIDWQVVAGNPYGTGDDTKWSGDAGSTWPTIQGVDANFKVFGARTSKSTTCTVTATPSTVATSGVCTIQVTVRDSDDQLVQGPGTVNLVKTGGTLGQTSLTLVNGQASTTWTAPASVGNRTITANYPGHSYGGTDYQACSCNTSVTVVAQQRSTTTSLTLNPSSTTTRSTINVSATVRDNLNNLVPGGSVSFSCSTGHFACGQATCAVATVNGVASTTWTAGNSVGTFAIQASYSGYDSGAIVYGPSSDSENVSVDYTNMATTTTVTVSPDYPYINGRSFATVEVRDGGGNLVPGGSVQFSAPAGSFGPFWSNPYTIALAGGMGSTTWHAPGSTGNRVITGNYQEHLAGGNRYLASSDNDTAHVTQDNDSTGTSLQWMTMWNTDYSNTSWNNLSSTDDDARGFSNKLGWAGVEYANQNACEKYMKRAGSGGQENDIFDVHDFTYYSGHGSPDYITFNTSCDDHRLRYSDADGAWGDRDAEWVAFSACEVLSNYGVNWMATMNGIHLECGFHTIMADSSTYGGVFAGLLFKDGVYDEPHTITQAWFLACDRTLGNPWWVHRQRVIADEWENFDDHLWGEGYVSPDPVPDNTHYGQSHDYTALNWPSADADPDNPNDGYTAVAGQVMRLDGSNSSDPDVGDVLFFAWDLDTATNTDSGDWDNDGTDEANDDADLWGRRPQHVFPTPGVYNIALTVRDDDWQTNQDFTTVTVTASRGGEGDAGGGLRDAGTNGEVEIVDDFPALPPETQMPLVHMIGTALGYNEFMSVAAYWGMQGAAGLDELGDWNMVDGNNELVVNQFSGNVMYVDRSRAYIKPHDPPFDLPSETEAIQVAEAFLDANDIERTGAVLDRTTDVLIEETHAGSRTPLYRVPFQRRVNYGRTINVMGQPYPVVGPGGKIMVMIDEYRDVVLFTKVWRHAYPQEDVPLHPAAQAIADFHRLGTDALIGGSRVPPCQRIEIDNVSVGYHEADFSTLQTTIYPVYVLDLTCEDEVGSRQVQVYLPAVSPPLEVSIEAPTNGLEVEYATPITFSGSSTNGVPPHTYEWHSDVDGLLGTAAAIDVLLRVNQQEGEVRPHTITLRVTDVTGFYAEKHIQVTVRPPAGDTDGDGDADLEDLATCVTCLAGPGVSTPPEGCLPGYFALCDLESDTDVDLADFAFFQEAFGGSGWCGNGYIEGSEECDDGGESAVCDDDCSIAECGDGTANVTAGEECDEGGESATCDADCTAAQCGDGTVNITAGEECDDGGESATCDADCTIAVCGDGTANATAGEECDEGGETATCDADCTAAECGDGTVNVTAGEECDDGGESAACDDDCTAAVCGDGTLNVTAGEECDDGNTNGGDGCSADCQLEEPPLPECTISFDASCPNVVPECGAFFDGPGSCVSVGGNCVESPPRVFRLDQGAPLFITLDGDLNKLYLFFAGFSGSVGMMEFFDADGLPVDYPLVTDFDCGSDPPFMYFRTFSTPVRSIRVTAFGGWVYIDTFHVNPP